MSLDRIVKFAKETSRRPCRREIEPILEDFFNGAAQIEWNTDRYFVSLPGTVSFAFRRLPYFKGTPRADHAQEEYNEKRERWIELWTGKVADGEAIDKIDVLTRHQDDYTNALADSLAKIVALYFDGEQEPN